MWPRGRPQSQQNTGSPNYGVGFNQYPQGPFRLAAPQQQYSNRQQRRDRARPRFQYPYYSDQSLSSNYSTNAPNTRGGNARGVGRGTGLLNATPRSVYTPKLQTNNKRQNENERAGNISGQRDDNRLNKSGKNRYEVDQSVIHLRQNGNENRVGRNHHGDVIQPTTYFCPKCKENYTIRYTQTKYAGKVPLILHCNHTMCQECIYQCLKSNKVNCPICSMDSTLTQEQTPVCQSDMQTIFPPNFYLLGVMSYYKTTASHLRNLENMTFVSTTGARKYHASLPEPSERCCFTTCSKEATMFCPSCEGIYCSDCCTVVHKSTKKLMSHEPVLRRKQKFSLMLENCGEHPTMQVEFFCKTCDLTACCYCVLDKHTDHERVALYHLNTIEMEEFKRQKQIAEKVLKEVLSTQKKATRLANFNTESVRKEVCQYFADCHAKLESLEKKLCDELENFKSSNRGLDSVQSSLISSAEQLKQLVAFNEDKIGDKKLNLRGALEKLRAVENIPRFLLNKEGMSEPVRFVFNNAIMEALDENFLIEKCKESEYRLVTEKELPEDYVINTDDSDSEVGEALSAILNKSIQESEQTSLPKTNDLPVLVSASAESSVKSKSTPRFVKGREHTKKKLDMERVEVQHINSMDSFFVQFINDQSKLGQLNKDIENFVKMGGTQTVQEPQLNDLYLALYVNESHGHKEQKWCRARLTDIKKGENGPVYEMFFIDYGKTQIVDANRIRDIPALLVQKRPFVIECMVHNPMGVNWNKKAHLSLAKILNGKDVYMMEKCQNHGIYEVDLMIASSDGGITSVTDILVHAHNVLEPQNDDSVSMDGSYSTKKDAFCPMLKVYPNSKQFTKNQKEKVVLANVVDPHNIFVHLVQFRENFKSMNHAIKKAYKSDKSGGCIPIEGTYVIVEYKDSIRSNWHRAFIKSVDLNSDKVHVLLVDWGLNVVVSSRNIRPLQESFTRLESQAVLVKLAHIAPYNKQPTWSPYAANFLQAYLRTQDVLKMIVQDTEPEVDVALFDISGNVDICLNAMMVENNLADSIGPISTKLEWPLFDVTNPEFSEEDGLMSSLLKKVDEQADDSEDEDLTDVKKRQVDVVKMDAPDLIWVKFLEFRERESKMFNDLQIHYSQEQKRKPSWEVGEQCVTEVGHEYARGKILEVLGNEYKIYLLDKVKEITAPTDKIYVYDKYFAKYPQAVIKSHLANIRPAGDTGRWSSSSIEALQEIFSKHTRIYANKAPESDAELSKKSLPLDMWYGLVIRGGPLDPDRIKYVSINNSLVKLGFAYKVPRPVTSKSSASKAASASPVKTAATGEDLLKSLINANKSEESSEASLLNIDVPSETELVAEQDGENGTNRDPEVSNAEGSEKKSTGAIKKTVVLKRLPKDKGKNDRSTDYKAKSQQTKGLERSREQELEKYDASDDDSTKNWSAIVDKELGELGPDSSLQANDNLEDTAVPSKYESESSPYHKREVAIDDWLPAFRLTKKEFQARVTCVETGGHLYLHEEAMDDVYYKMQENIKEYFEGNPPEITDHQWEPGQLCTIKFTDGNWYRGKILKVKSRDEISVFMIDFGSDHDLSPDSLFREVLYTDVGAFATKVKLDKVYSRSGSWLTSDYDRFHEMVTDWCRIVVKGPVDVELPLVEVYNENGVFVNQKLIEICPNLSRCSNFPVHGGDDEDEPVVIECIESEGSVADEILMDNFEREPDVKRTRSIESRIMDINNLEKLEYKMRPLPQELLEGKKVLMEIGGFMHYDKLALRLPEDDTSEDLYNLMIDMQDIVDALPNLTEFTVGRPCIAQFSEDDVWYRARITSTKMADLGFVDVIFVDYGNSESVPTKSIKIILPEHLELPQQSWEVTLNVAFNDDKAEADVISVMQLMNSLDRKKKLVKLVRENPLTVELYEKNGKLCFENLISTCILKSLVKGDSE